MTKKRKTKTIVKLLQGMSLAQAKQVDIDLPSEETIEQPRKIELVQEEKPKQEQQTPKKKPVRRRRKKP